MCLIVSDQGFVVQWSMWRGCCITEPCVSIFREVSDRLRVFHRFPWIFAHLSCSIFAEVIEKVQSEHKRTQSLHLQFVFFNCGSRQNLKTFYRDRVLMSALTQLPTCTNWPRHHG